MRAPVAVAIAALLAAGACSPFGGAGDGADESAAAPDREAGEAAVVQIVRGADGGCALRWDGQPIAEGALPGRAFQTLDAIVRQAGGPENIMQLPRVVLEAPQDARYDCFRGPLDALTSGGFAEIVLRVAERGRGADWVMRVPMPSAGPAPQPFAVIDLRAGGAVLVDGQPVESAALRTLLVDTPAAPASVGMTDGSLLVHPEPGATFASLHEVAGLAMENQRELQIRPRGDAAVPPPPENSQSATR